MINRDQWRCQRLASLHILPMEIWTWSHKETQDILGFSGRPGCSSDCKKKKKNTSYLNLLFFSTDLDSISPLIASLLCQRIPESNFPFFLSLPLLPNSFSYITLFRAGISYVFYLYPCQISPLKLPWAFRGRQTKEKGRSWRWPDILVKTCTLMLATSPFMRVQVFGCTS